MRIDHINLDRIIGIRVYEEQGAAYRWLPAKQKTTFFGLIKLNKWYSEGFYMYGCYEQDYDILGSWETNAYTAQELIQSGYLVRDKVVYYKPYVNVYLQDNIEISKKFNSLQEAQEWVEQLKSKCTNEFEIINYENN
jgi:hypothetical protein